MNKKAIITALLALIVIVANAQQRLTVRDSLTQEPIAYTSVWFGNEAGGYTDESGTIEIPEGTKRIRLSHICYETRSISIADNSGQTVLLVPKSVNLGEVSVSAKAPKRMKTTTAGLTKEKTQTCHRGANGFEMALFIPYDSTWAETPSMPLSALTSVCQMPRLVRQETNPSLMAGLSSNPAKGSARMMSN